MNKNKLLERQKFVTGKPLPNRVAGSIFSRRTGNYVVMESESDEALNNSFFDFEDELSGMTSAAEQFARTFASDNNEISTMQEREEEPQILQPQIRSNPIPLMLEEAEEESENIRMEEVLELSDEAINIEQTPKFEFVQCSFHKEDGTRCKRQAPKGKTICSSHQKMLDKQGK